MFPKLNVSLLFLGSSKFNVIASKTEWHGVYGNVQKSINNLEIVMEERRGKRGYWCDADDGQSLNLSNPYL